MPNSLDVFLQIVESKDQCPILIFDLDSTLYNVSHRTQKILIDFANEPDIVARFPREAKELIDVRVGHRDWGLKETLIKHDFRATEEFYSLIRNYWNQHFFSNYYLDYDKPYDGAVDYVNKLQSHDIEINYLTGRDEKNMKAGTIVNLKKWGFPFYEDRNDHLIMKPEKGLVEDEDFKTIQLAKLIQLNRPIWFFENEPVIINKVQQALPNVKIVWLDTTHSRKASPPKNIFVIKDYILPEN